MSEDNNKQPAPRCRNCGTLEHHYHDDDGRLWLWCGKCQHRWRWHSDTPPHLFKPPVHADHIRQVVLAFPDVTPAGWEDRAEPRPAPAPSARDALVSQTVNDPAQIDLQKPWQGTIAKKPWHYRVTAVIPHRNTPEHLELCLQFLAQQTEPPYVMIIDTGSDDESLARVLALRNESVEVHQIACHAVEEYADTVCYAMDLAMSACRTEYLWCLHCDCFIINRNLLAELLDRSDGGQRPAIGYESSSANKHAECRGMVSHTCTLLHMPTMRRLDVTWSRAGLAERAKAAGQSVVFDPEMSLNYRLRERGIEPLILGPEQTSDVERDANRVHLRSGTLAEQRVAGSPNSHASYESMVRELRGIVDRESPGCIARRNLAYFVAPFSNNDIWRRNVRQLLKRIALFNGRRIVAIATGPKLDSVDEVKKAFKNERIEFIVVENDPSLRERVAAIQMLSTLESTDPREATFYAHAKGVATIGNPQGVMYWRNAMYHELLDFPEKILSLLQKHPCVGTHRKRHGVYPDGLKGSEWHYSGTFYWFRNDALFGQSDWREKLPTSGWGTEAYPGIVFKYEDACCVFGDEMANPYDPQSYSNPIADDEGDVGLVTGALRVELLSPRWLMSHSLCVGVELPT